MNDTITIVFLAYAVICMAITVCSSGHVLLCWKTCCTVTVASPVVMVA